MTKSNYSKYLSIVSGTEIIPGRNLPAEAVTLGKQIARTMKPVLSQREIATMLKVHHRTVERWLAA